MKSTWWIEGKLPAFGLRANKGVSMQVMAKVMGTEAAIVRSQFVSGTHAISTALFACLRPGDCLVAVAGR